LSASQAVFTNASDELVSNTITGTGDVVMSTTPTITTPALAGETFSTSATVTAGTDAQAQGPLTTDYNVITTTAASPSGVTLPTATTGRRIVVVNKGTNSVNVYPASGGTIDALAANAAIALPVGGVMIFNASSVTQWYSTYNLYTTLTNEVQGYTTTATAGTTTTLTASSTYRQFFTGTLAQTIVLPVVTTLILGRSYEIANNSTGVLTIQSSGLNTIASLSPGITGVCTCIAITGTGIASWHFEFTSYDTAPAELANLMGFTTTATAAGTTTLTNTSSSYQIFTGTTTQTIVLPVVTTLVQGWTFHIVNNSTGVLTVNSSGSNLVISVPAGVTTMCTCILNTGTTAASWEAGLTDFSTVTGTGSVVLSASPTFTSVPAAPTAAEKVATTQLATCAFVDRLRSLTTPSTAASGAVTAVVGDRGALLAQTSGSVTIPASVFAARDVLTIFNNSASDITITQGASLTLYLVGTATTGNRTLAQRGLATVVFISATVAVVSGGGLT
jgi:hypothetical protein